MKLKVKKIIEWLPRVLGILFLAFISMFAMDAFSAEASWIEKIGGFLIHLIPSYILLATLIVAWKRRKLGGILYLLLAAAYVLIARFDWIAVAIISGPVVLIGILFILSEEKK